MSRAKINELANIALIMGRYGAIFENLIHEVGITEQQVESLIKESRNDKTVDELAAMIAGFKEPDQGCGKCLACLTKRAMETKANNPNDSLLGLLQAMMPDAIIVKMSRAEFEAMEGEDIITKH